METSKLKGYINISHKGGYLLIGSDTLKNYTKKLYLIIYDKRALNSTMKIVERFKQREIPAIGVANLEELTSIKNCKIIGLKNKNLSDLIANLLKEQGV